MNTENQNQTEIQKPKFVAEGLSRPNLPNKYVPVYYGFNVRPRQVQYYKVQQSVVTILSGRVTRSRAVEFLLKVKLNASNAQAKNDEFKKELARLENLYLTSSTSEIRKMYRKKHTAVENKYLLHQDKLNAYNDAVSKVEEYLK